MIYGICDNNSGVFFIIVIFVITNRLLFYSQEQFPVIIFEDIALKSYNSVNSKLNLDETKIVAEKLASWHGSSVFLGVDVSYFLYYFDFVEV